MINEDEMEKKVEEFRNLWKKQAEIISNSNIGMSNKQRTDKLQELSISYREYYMFNRLNRKNENELYFAFREARYNLTLALDIAADNYRNQHNEQSLKKLDVFGNFFTMLNSLINKLRIFR